MWWCHASNAPACSYYVCMQPHTIPDRPSRTYPAPKSAFCFIIQIVFSTHTVILRDRTHMVDIYTSVR